MPVPAQGWENRRLVPDNERDLPSASLIEDFASVAPLREAWDALAVRAGAPFGTPVWAEAWWRHLAPQDARLSIVAVHDRDELVGLAPFYASRSFGVTELRLLSGGWASRLGIVASPGREREVAAAVAAALAKAKPIPDVIHWEAIDAAAPWPDWISADWPGGRGHRLNEESRRAAPVVHFGQSSYEDWFAGQSSHFRGHMRRDRRKIEKAGATFRYADSASIERDLVAFERLHSARWEGRGGSSAVGSGAMTALAEVAEELMPSGRFRLSMIDGPDGEAVSAQVFVAAGGVVAFWNTGFDMAWRKYSPGALAVLVAIEDAFDRGEELMDLGGGEAAYKDRVADEDLPVAWRTNFPRGPRYPLARLRRMPASLARTGSQALRKRVGAERVNRVRGLLKR
jgi:CelD/BcsL family acetyltransferase involved in cellulose biosynthesis